MVDFGSSGLDDGMQEVDQSFGIGVFEILSVAVDEKASNSLNEFRRHLEFLLRVDLEFESSHTFE